MNEIKRSWVRYPAWPPRKLTKPNLPNLNVPKPTWKSLRWVLDPCDRGMEVRIKLILQFLLSTLRHSEIRGSTLPRTVQLRTISKEVSWRKV
jgi:hypothetical protein